MTRRRGLFERLMFSFMGPPQLGDPSAPVTYTPDRAAHLCHRCSQPWDAHQRVHTDNMTYTRCP